MGLAVWPRRHRSTAPVAPVATGAVDPLKAGKADLAVVRPDVAMPGNGLTLAVLRELAAFVATLGASGVEGVPDTAAVLARWPRQQSVTVPGALSAATPACRSRTSRPWARPIG